MRVAQSCLTLCTPMGCLYSPWNSPGQNAGIGMLSSLQWIFLTQESDCGLLHCRWILYQLSYQGSLECLLDLSILLYLKLNSWSLLKSLLYLQPSLSQFMATPSFPLLRPTQQLFYTPHPIYHQILLLSLHNVTNSPSSTDTTLLQAAVTSISLHSLLSPAARVILVSYDSVRSYLVAPMSIRKGCDSYS